MIESKAPPASQFSANETKWIRWAEERFADLVLEAQNRAFGEKNSDLGQNGTLAALGRNIVDLEGRLTDALAGVTIDGSQITTGIIPNSRIDGLPATQVSGVWDKGVSASSPLYTTSSLTADAALISAGAFNLDLGGVAGTRRTSWIHQTAGVGYASSSREKKTNFVEGGWSAEQFLAVCSFLFQYKALLDQRDNPENPNYCPVLHVPFEPGFVAEDLVDAGLGAFVFYLDGGVVGGINYDMFAAVGFSVVGRNHEARLRRIEDALGLGND